MMIVDNCKVHGVHRRILGRRGPTRVPRDLISQLARGLAHLVWRGAGDGVAQQFPIDVRSLLSNQLGAGPGRDVRAPPDHRINMFGRQESVAKVTGGAIQTGQPGPDPQPP